MAKSVSLPFEVPIIATTQGSAAVGIAMTGHPTAHNQILNQAVSLFCRRRFIKGFTTPEVSIINWNLNSYKIFDRYEVNFRFVTDYCIQIIKQMLDEGFYVYYSGVDDFYLPEKSWYGIRHLYHDGIICGYDDNDSTISIAAYDINWVFRPIRIPQECFVQGVDSALKATRYDNMTAYKLKENVTIEINEKDILKLLKEYLDSNFEKYPADEDGDVRGIVVHNYLAMYIDKLKDGSIPFEKMDWRALRPIWEHKKCMYERIKAIEAKNGWGDELSNRYAPIVEKANQLRMMYAVYHKNHNDKLLDKIRDGLLELADRDRTLVEELVNRLEVLTI